MHAYKALPITSIIPSGVNPRRHPERQIAQLRRSIREFGFTVPILVDEDGRLLAGHGRLQAARDEGLSDVPAIMVGGLSDAQKLALTIADNQIAANSEWDEGNLSASLKELLGAGADLTVLGFDANALTRALDLGIVGGKSDEEHVPSDGPHVSVGDIWSVGQSRVACGDAADDDLRQRLLGDFRPHLMVTDPPYGVNYVGRKRSSQHRTENILKSGAVPNDHILDWTPVFMSAPSSVAYVWYTSLGLARLCSSLDKCGYDMRSLIVWVKEQFVLGRSDYQWSHETCYYGVKRGEHSHWTGSRTRTTVWNVQAREDSGHGHPTQKPVECMRRPMIDNSERGDAIYDPFLGSGSTLIAAESVGRRCFGVDISPEYVSIAIQRWHEYTGIAPVLAHSGVAT